MSKNIENQYSCNLCELEQLVKLFNGDTSVCFICKCVEFKDYKGKFESIEVLGMSDCTPKPRNEDGVRYMVMDLEEISMMKESGISIIISKLFILPNQRPSGNIKEDNNVSEELYRNSLNEIDSSDRLVVDEFPSAYSELNFVVGETRGNEDV